MPGDATRPLRVGVIGTGWAARRAHLPAWARLSGAEVIALCDIDAAALAAAAPLAPGAELHADPETFFAAELDAVAICASNAAHFPLARRALASGRHVLCEKPLGISAREVEALGELAEARGLVLMAHHQLRFGPEARAARDFVRSGALGKAHHARLTALRRDAVPTSPGFIDPALAGGGALLDLGVHVLDLALWLLDFPRAVSASGSVRAAHAGSGRIPGRWGDWDQQRFGVEDMATGFVRFEDGTTLGLECAWMGHYPEEGLGCTLYGANAALHWPSGVVTRQEAEFSRQALAMPAGEDGPHAAAIAAFVEAVVAGSPAPVPWREARASLAILDALYASARSGREVEVTGG